MTSVDLSTTGGAVKSGEGLAQWTRVLCILFFFSGFPALIYQLIWERALFLVFGVNIESVTIVVTAFMLGLGFGSLAGGWLSRWREVSPLLLLAAIEFLTGAFGLVSLHIFHEVGDLIIGLSLPATAVVSLALVILPTLLMGATLPLLVSHVVRRSGNTGGAIGLLYYVNTLGAGAACLVSAVALFPFLGMSGSIYVAVAFNSVVALCALAFYWHDRRRALPATPVSMPKVCTIALGLPLACVLAAAGGYVSLSYEIFFFRTVSFASGSSATAFAVTLSAFLVGIASGSREAGERCESAAPAEIARGLVDALLKAALVGLVFLPLLNRLAWLNRGMLGAVVIMVYLVARYWGALLPCLAEFSVPPDDRAGTRTAALYLANILGSATGLIVTGFVLMDRVGLVALAALLVAAGLAVTLALIVAFEMPARQRLQRGAIAVAAAVAAMVAIPPLSERVLENLQWKGAAYARPFVKVVEDRSGIISVTDNGAVFGHGMYDGRFNTDLVHDTNGIVRPYALSLFHPAPRDVLMIGLSSGSWAQVIAHEPAVRSLTVIEINPGYVKLIATEPEVASILSNPKIKIVTDDGRRWLRRHPERRFDAIVSNTTWHFRASATNLLSVEFLDLVRRHLNPGGIVFYNTTESDRVQRTGCLAFAHGARFINHMVLSDQPIDWNFERWRRTLMSYRIDGKPVIDPTRAEDRAAIDGLMAWQASLRPDAAPDRPIEQCRDLLVRTAGKREVTDDNMGTEWRYFLDLD